MTLADLDPHVDHFRERVVQDAMASATARYWERRAEELERAKPDPERDFTGRASLEELREQWRRCDERARACRNAAVVAEWYDPEEVIADRIEEYARWHDTQRFARVGAVVCPECGTPTSPWTCSCGATRVGEATA